MTQMPLDMAVVNGLVVGSRSISPLNVLIKDGLIADLAPWGTCPEAARVIDAKGRYVLPGIIDAHLHPVYADRIDSLSAAAASEGITTLIPYIGAVKAWGQSGGLIPAIEGFIEEGERTSLVDFSIHCTLMQADMDGAARTVPELIEKGIVSFKAFMAYAKRGMKLEDHQLLRLMTIISGHHGLLAAHAENGDIIDYMEERFIGLGQESPEFYPPSHPRLSEAEAVFRLLTLADSAGCRIYLPHLSTAESLEVVALFRKWGRVEFFSETCPHYLCLTEGEMLKRGSLAKMAPPLRHQSDIDALWQALSSGLVEVIASDAAGNDTVANEPLWDKVFSAPNGIPGVESLFKVVYQEGINQGRLSLPALVSKLCENPARIFGLYPQKGVLTQGADADLVIVDPGATYTIPEKNRNLKVDYSLFAGKTGVGAPMVTMQRGKVLFENGVLKAGPGQGRFLAARL